MWCKAQSSHQSSLMQPTRDGIPVFVKQIRTKSKRKMQEVVLPDKPENRKAFRQPSQSLFLAMMFQIQSMKKV